ncbi:hypothetical protein MSG28_009373, partial [Choristoneura fumiferana]
MKDFKKLSDEITTQMKDLTDRVEILSWTLQQNFIDSFLNYTTTKSLEQLNYRNRKGNIVNDYANISEAIKSLRESLNETNDEFNDQCEKLDKSIDVLNDLCTAVEGKRVLELANHEFRRHNYCEAMVAVKELQDRIQKLKFNGDTAKALLNLVEQAENQLALYTAHLSVDWEDLFSWSEKRSLTYLTYSLSVQQSDPILLQKVLRSLQVTERLNAELGVFSCFFIDQLLHNVIRHNCEIFTEDDVGAVVFNIKITLANKNRPNYQTIFNNLTAIFEFLQSTLGSQLESAQKFIEIFADSIREKFFHKIIEDCIRNNLPSCNSTYENYTNLVIELDAFNKFLIESKFVEADKSPLNKYIDNTECVLYNKKCDKLLYDVRNLLSQSLSYGTEVVGTEPMNENESILEVTDKSEKDVWDLNKPVFLSKCVISQNVKKILRMIVEHLEESTKLPEKYSTQLVSYIKDITVMYQSIVPKKFKTNLECCPLDIALFFNNCFYLAHGLLGPPWRNTLPAALSNHLTTVMLVCIQDLRVLGLEKVSLYLQKQKNVITQTVNNAIIQMKDLKCCWHNILPTRMYEMGMCTLVQAFCQAVLQRIFADCKLISEELVYMLSVRLQDAVEDITALFEEPIELDKKINVWLKFTKMPQLLKAQLLEIVEIWNTKELSQSYACEEVRQIVKMRFPDNKYRLKILKEIHIQTAFLIIALVIAVNEGGATAQDDSKTDQVADESKNRAVTIVDGPKYVTQPSPTQAANQTQPEQRPPSKPPHPAPDKQKIHVYVEKPQPYHQMILGPPSRHLYPKPMKLRHPPNSAHKFPRVIPLGSRHKSYYHSNPPTRQPLAFAASSGRPVRVPLKPPKFSVPVETINGIRTDFVRPPKIVQNSTTTTTTSTTTTTTTQRPLRNKRIWPKKILERKTEIFQNTSSAVNTGNTDKIPSTNSTNSTDLEIASATHYRFKYVNMNRTAQTSTTTFEPLTITRGYRRVQRVPKHTTTTTASVTDANYTRFTPNDWVPIVPSHYPKKRRPAQTPISKRSDSYFTSPEDDKHTIYLQNIPEDDKRTMFLQNFPEDNKRPTYLHTVPENKHTMYLQNVPEDNKRVTYLQTAPEDNK